ncbi:MAG TPA: DUF4149 domain-containing protein [Gemmataceae bacterium]|nr:DUF4149 domain-containing protein [Gemmataceae bacterium]
MTTLLRRLVVVAALLFWQGGFTFYAAVVVPVGREVLGSHTRQGFITRRVATYLNLAGAVALVPLAWDAAATADPAAWRRRLRWLAWALLLLTLLALFWLHPRMTELMDLEQAELIDRGTFRLIHKVYLWASVVQWVAGVGYVVLMLGGWRAADTLGTEGMRLGDGEGA